MTGSKKAVFIRPGRLEEVQRLQAVQREAGERFRAIGMAQISEHDPDEVSVFAQAIEEERLLVAELANQGQSPESLIGFLRHGSKDGSPHIEELNVLPAAAGSRIGAQLIDAFRQDIEDKGKNTCLTLTTFRDVPWNAPYYRSLGFQVLTQEDLGPELSGCLAEETNRLPPALFGPRVAMRLASRKPLF